MEDYKLASAADGEIGLASSPRTLFATMKAHIAICRFDHAIKNLFVIPGMIIPLSVRPSLAVWGLVPKIILGLVATTLVACSNYVVNEVLDAPFDRLHPKKKNRPAACGFINIRIAYVQWVAMMAIGLWIGSNVSPLFVITAATLWVMGCLYNIRPFRTKDVVYLDVITESVNNPLRLLLGWFIVTNTLVPPVSLLLAYWALGCYFMGLKRFSELRSIQHKVAASYRESFKHYTERKLLVSVNFYGAASMLFFGAFSMRYRMELVLVFPFIAYLMATYFSMSYEDDSAAQNPEKLYKHPWLMGGVVLTIAAFAFLLFHPLPGLTRLLVPTLP
jgi:4-hydroxybenzoate polyprenyltransferase